MLGTEVRFVPFEPYYLGVIDGMRDDEVQALHPDVAERIARWRSGQSEIHELCIPGGTDHRAYFAEAKNFLDEEVVANPVDDAVVVGTRSTLIVLTSVLLGRSPEPGGNYREIGWDNGAYVAFEVGGSRAILVERSQVDLEQACEH